MSRTIVILAIVALLACIIVLGVRAADSRVAMVRPYDAKLERMAQCESGKRWWVKKVLKDGTTYYGGLQFDLSTWRSVGGRGYPHKASELEQKYRAVKLIKVRGYAPWPVCGSA